MKPFELATSIIDRCKARGFAEAGVSIARPTDHAKALTEWLSAGAHGKMDFMTEALDVRLDPRGLLEGTRSFVMVADLYASRASATDPSLPSGHGRIARYVRGVDYHKLIKRRLHELCDELRAEHPGHRFRTFVDTAPALERELAQRAGLGWTGKNTMLIHPALGSYMVLGGFATTLVLEPPDAQPAIRDHCGTCTRCIDACPTDAITSYRVDATRCISYLTIEHRGPIDERYHAPMGQWLYGCDICQEVCPHNSPSPAGARAAEGRVPEAYAPTRSSFDLLELLGWDANDRRGAFNSSAMKRATLAMMKRNALIVLANAAQQAGSESMIARIEDVAWDAKEPEDVRALARSLVARLRPTTA
jgi:epoxyqueuosine reductase